MSDYLIGVVGNPNCGKTTLFNALTGTKQRVGNWPGVTVDRKSGEYTFAEKKIEVVDLPGIYSLSATSVDEEVARDYILSGEADLFSTLWTHPTWNAICTLPFSSWKCRCLYW